MATTIRPFSTSPAPFSIDIMPNESTSELHFKITHRFGEIIVKEEGLPLVLEQRCRVPGLRLRDQILRENKRSEELKTVLKDPSKRAECTEINLRLSRLELGFNAPILQELQSMHKAIQVVRIHLKPDVLEQVNAVDQTIQQVVAKVSFDNLKRKTGILDLSLASSNSKITEKFKQLTKTCLSLPEGDPALKQLREELQETSENTKLQDTRFRIEFKKVAYQVQEFQSKHNWLSQESGSLLNTLQRTIQGLSEE